MDRRLPCQACGTWTCARCGWRRHRANLHYPGQDCASCGGTEGSMVPTRHGGAGGEYAARIYYGHNPQIGPVCAVWHLSPTEPPYEPWPGPCGHKSCREIRWGPL